MCIRDRLATWENPFSLQSILPLQHRALKFFIVPSLRIEQVTFSFQAKELPGVLLRAMVVYRLGHTYTLTEGEGT